MGDLKSSYKLQLFSLFMWQWTCSLMPLIALLPLATIYAIVAQACWPKANNISGICLGSFTSIFIVSSFKAALLWNPYKEARHGILAWDKRHEIRFEMRKWRFKFCNMLCTPKAPKKVRDWRIFETEQNSHGEIWQARQCQVFLYHDLRCFQRELNWTKVFHWAKRSCFWH